MPTKTLLGLGALIILGTLVVIYRCFSAKKLRCIHVLAESKCVCGDDLKPREFDNIPGKSN